MIKLLLIIGWNTAATCAACISLPGSIELLMLSVAALLPGKRAKPSFIVGAWRVAIVVPAHDEEAVISPCIESLLQAESPSDGSQVQVFVVADNCSDQTAEVAIAAGASVLERHDSERRGKGHALNYAFSHLIELGYDCVLVVDADSRVSTNFIAAAAKALRSGDQAIQARYLVHNTLESTRSRLMSFALRAFHVLRPLGRENLRLSSGIFGNGFGLRSDTLTAVPYLATSLVEDLEYHIALVRSGRRVTFLDHATVYAEMPVKAKDVKSQRSRWEGGRLRMLMTKAPSLLQDVVAGRMRCLEPLLELLLLPLAFHVTLVLIAASARLTFVRDIGLVGVLIVLLHLLATIALGDQVWRDLGTLMVAPFYVIWKIVLIPTLISNSRADRGWVRTGRNADTSSEE
jgi:cellulose synthase/poly-beta-1,6-N-acetylglucosamine synthase-like glycosyltransferase